MHSGSAGLSSCIVMLVMLRAHTCSFNMHFACQAGEVYRCHHMTVQLSADDLYH